MEALSYLTPICQYLGGIYFAIYKITYIMAATLMILAQR